MNLLLLQLYAQRAAINLMKLSMAVSRLKKHRLKILSRVFNESHDISIQNINL